MSERKGGSPSGVASVLLAGTLWGIIGIWTRNLMAGGLSPWSIVSVRNLAGLAVLTPLCAIFDRSVFHVELRHLKYFFGTGILSTVVYTLCYYTCQRICSLAVATVFMYTSPIFVVLLSALLWRERITGRKVLALVLTVAGCAMTCGLLSGHQTVTALGVALGLGSGFFYSLYSIFSRCALAHYSSMTVTYWTYVFSALGSLFILRPSEIASAFSQPYMWGLAAGMVVVSSMLPVILYTRGLATVEAGRASIMCSVELVVACVVGILAFREPLTILSAAGVVCILVAVYMLR